MTIHIKFDISLFHYRVFLFTAIFPVCGSRFTLAGVFSNPCRARDSHLPLVCLLLLRLHLCIPGYVFYIRSISSSSISSTILPLIFPILKTLNPKSLISFTGCGCFSRVLCACMSQIHFPFPFPQLDLQNRMSLIVHLTVSDFSTGCSGRI